MVNPILPPHREVSAMHFATPELLTAYLLSQGYYQGAIQAYIEDVARSGYTHLIGPVSRIRAGMRGGYIVTLAAQADDSDSVWGAWVQ